MTELLRCLPERAPEPTPSAPPAACGAGAAPGAPGAQPSSFSGDRALFTAESSKTRLKTVP